MDDFRDKIEDLAHLYHLAQMKHINADRMGDRHLRAEGNDLEEEFETKLDELAKELDKLRKVAKV